MQKSLRHAVTTDLVLGIQPKQSSHRGYLNWNDGGTVSSFILSSFWVLMLVDLPVYIHEMQSLKFLTTLNLTSK